MTTSAFKIRGIGTRRLNFYKSDLDRIRLT